MTHIEVQINPQQNDVEVLRGAGGHRPSAEVLADYTSDIPVAPALDAVRGRKEQLSTQRVIDRDTTVTREAGWVDANEVRGINDNATEIERSKPGGLQKATSWLIEKVGGPGVIDRTIDTRARIKTQEELHMHDALGIDRYPRRQPSNAAIQAHKLKTAAETARKFRR